MVRASDHGLTAKHSTVLVAVYVTRQPNLPPEVIPTNASLTYYQGDPFMYPADMSFVGEAEDTVPLPGLGFEPVARVRVLEQDSYKKLTYELLQRQELFSLDPNDGSIRLRRMQSGHLSSGQFPLNVKVSNGSQFTNGTVLIKMLAVTDEMYESSVVIRVANMTKSLFFAASLDGLMKKALAVTTGVGDEELVRILGVQNAEGEHLASWSESLRRTRRSLPESGSVDVLVAVYDQQQNLYIEPVRLERIVRSNSDKLSSTLHYEIEPISDVCIDQVISNDSLPCSPEYQPVSQLMRMQFFQCPRGRCVTRISLTGSGGMQMNRIEVHGVSQVFPRFRLVASCECPTNFGGPTCDQPLNECARAVCPAPKICVPRGSDSYSCVCAPPMTGENCDVPKFGSLQFTGGSSIHWRAKNADMDRLEVSFSLRTRQANAPLAFVKWNVLQSFHLRLDSMGRLLVHSLPVNDSNVPVGPTGRVQDEYLWFHDTESMSLNDGRWHSIHFILSKNFADPANPPLIAKLVRSSQTVSDYPAKTIPSSHLNQTGQWNGFTPQCPH
ncbi:Protocadherin Fat 4 [Cichlidogyrus casuarinus]|uniref:Protocadherin Fat 4 n=1 Tax=Cichlidogyrus casuarinus TaxID=1844966 RepID=A0ABD2QLA0_9PLAT